MMNKKIILLVGIIFMALAPGCRNNQPRYHPGGPYYYASWASYQLPFRPVDEISEETAQVNHKNGQSYYIAYFYDNGLIKSFEKRYQGRRLHMVTYFYENEKLKKSESIDENGKTTIALYDKVASPKRD